MELYPLRVKEAQNKDIDLSMEEAAEEKKNLIDWCDNMVDEDITDFVMTCEQDLCNRALNPKNSWGTLHFLTIGIILIITVEYKSR